MIDQLNGIWICQYIPTAEEAKFVGMNYQCLTVTHKNLMELIWVCVECLDKCPDESRKAMDVGEKVLVNWEDVMHGILEKIRLEQRMMAECGMHGDSLEQIPE